MNLIYTKNEAEVFIGGIMDRMLELHPSLRDVAAFPMSYSRFLTFPASGTRTVNNEVKRGWHHCHEFGLLIHTAQVLDMALAALKPFEYSGAFEKIVLGVMWHDFAKTDDYDPTFDARGRMIDARKTEIGKTHHHIYTSTHKFENRAQEYGLNESLVGSVKHIILSHHGRLEWGSPVLPQTPEALIVHQADYLSAQYFGKFEDYARHSPLYQQ